MRRSLSPLLFTTVAFVLGALSPTGAALPPPPVVATSHGLVRGMHVESGARAFLGIPYAAPPVGARRWERPAPPEPWQGTLDARTAPPRCAQASPLASQEDCLYLNVHTPDPAPDNAPVMVWIHGGSFTFGEGLQTDGGTAGDRLAERFGVVVVSMNYRLGPFGFFAHPDREGTGNLGLADQLAALRWVKENIAAFGGDPERVTIFGESAGGMSVCAHLVAPESEGLFDRAIVQSGFCDAPAVTREEARRDAAALAARLGCDSEACMRARSTEAILEASDAIASGALADRRAWRPYVDGELLPASIATQVESGAFHRVPVIAGWNGDEGTLDVLFAKLSGELLFDEGATYDAVTARLGARYGVPVEAIRAQYPRGDDPAAALSDAIGDATLACPSRRFAAALARRGGEVYAYRFTHPSAEFQIPLFSGLGAFHSAEIQYVFDRPAGLFTRRFLGTERALSDAMAGAWARFAERGDPGGWPRFDAGEAHVVFDRGVTIARGADADACALWE